MQLQMAVRRQARYLRKFVPVQVPEIRVEEDDTKCVSCGQDAVRNGEASQEHRPNALDADF